MRPPRGAAHIVGPWLPLALFGFLAACGGGAEGGASAASAGARGGMPSLDACAVLADVNLGSLVGVTPDTLIAVLDRTEGNMSASQCVAASSTSPASVGLLVRYDAGGGNPATREEWIAKELEGDVLGMGEEAAAALRAAEAVPGMGDMALYYQLIGANLAVFWGEGRYQLVATSSDVPDAAAARRALEAVARRTLERH